MARFLDVRNRYPLSKMKNHGTLQPRDTTAVS